MELTGQQSVDSGNISITTEPPIPEEPSETEPEIEIVPKSEVSHHPLHVLTCIS